MKKVMISKIIKQEVIEADKDYVLVHNEQEDKLVRVKSKILNSLSFQNQIGKYLINKESVIKIKTNITRKDISLFISLQSNSVASNLSEKIDFVLTTNYNGAITYYLFQRIGNKRLIDIKYGFHDGLICLELTCLYQYTQFNLTLKTMDNSNNEIKEDNEIDSASFKTIEIP